MPLILPSPLFIVTTSLPNATVGVAYSAPIMAAGGFPPYSWQMTSTSDAAGWPLTSLSPIGVLSNANPPTAETVSITIQVSDSHGFTASQTYSLLVNAGAGLAGPRALWPGYTDSSHALLMAWATTQGGDNTYNLYRSPGPSTPVLTGITPTGPTIGGGGRAQAVFLDSGLSQSTAYTYTATAVIGGVETARSNAVVQKTLAGPTSGTGSTPVVPPTAPLEPNTWIVAPPAAGSLANVPAGNNLFIITQNGTNTNPSANPGGGTTYNGCSLAFALSTAGNINGGDVFALTPSTTPYSITNFNCPAYTGTNGFTYFVSTQALEYNAAGTLPAYSYVTSVRYSGFTLTAGPAAAATSATLTANFTGRTGYYPIKFKPSSGNLNETRYALFTNSSSAIQWAPGLVNAATTAVQAHIGNYVTPYDANLPSAINAGAGFNNNSPSVATIQFPRGSSGTGCTMNVGTAKVRFIGIALQVAPDQPYGPGLQFVACFAHPSNSSPPLDSVYYDRCIMTGGDTNLFNSGTANQMSPINRGIAANCSHLLTHQCFMYGFVDASGNSAGVAGGQDTQCLAIEGGQFISIQNCMLEGQNESVITAGEITAQNNPVTDLVRRYNFSHKPTQWQTNAIGREVKNHLECKVGQRVADYGNILQNSWSGQQSQGQFGRGFVCGARDQQCGWGTPGNTPWAAVVGVSGSTVTYSSATGALFGANGQLLALINAGGITPVIFKVASVGTSGSNFTITATAPFVGTFTAGGGVVPLASTSAGPWNFISDWDVHDNLIYDCNAAVYDFGSGDTDAACFTTRVRFQNNQFFMNPGIDDTASNKSQGWGLQFFSAATELIFDHNTVIVNQANGNYANGPSFTAGVACLTNFNSGNSPPQPVTDRVQITNNVLDGVYAFFLANNNVVGIGSINAVLSNSTFSNSAHIQDASTYSGTATGGNVVANIHAAVGYTGAGFSNWTSGSTSPTSAPLNPSDWNITTGTLATASTTGGPIGATV